MCQAPGIAPVDELRRSFQWQVWSGEPQTFVGQITQRNPSGVVGNGKEMPSVVRGGRLSGLFGVLVKDHELGEFVRRWAHFEDLVFVRAVA